MYVGFGKISAQLHTLIMHTPRHWDFRHCFELRFLIFFVRCFFKRLKFRERRVITCNSTNMEISEDV